MDNVIYVNIGKPITIEFLHNKCNLKAHKPNRNLSLDWALF